MTGYTYELVDKKLSFLQFAMRCARAFGALIEMRDEDMDAPIPDYFPPSDYHVNGKLEAEKTLARLRSISAEEAVAAERLSVSDSIARLEKSKAEEEEKRTFMQGVLSEVQAWKAPTPDHSGLRDFMIQQITTSLEGGDWYDKEIERLKNADLTVLVSERIARAEKDIVYHAEKYREECARCAERTKWVRDLRESLNTA
jgi:hypothetical protein